MDLYCVTSLILFSFILRLGVSFNSYSGKGKSPIFGDYEAQRHWTEITRHLPLNQWYNGSKDNDLQYWGLDYPPLTAYHSMIMGYIAEILNPQWVSLFVSRGHESYEHKLFMRSTVMIVDFLIYVNSIIYFVRFFMKKMTLYEQVIMATVMLSYPGLILVDHGHFQYNCVSLGFTVISVIFLLKYNSILGSVFFVLALNYKQMSLYHSFPFFFYLLGSCSKEKSWLRKLLKLASIGITVVITFVVCWLPFLTSLNLISVVLGRLFPFSRGLFEDKVANVWCSISVVFKIKRYLSQPHMVQLCLGTTLLACVPSCVDLLRFPTRKKFMYSLINCSLSFFLFSYQVHEKSILLVALPVSLVIPYNPLACTWFLFISTFSMYPLLVRDGQAISYLALMVLFLMLASFLFKFRTYPMHIKMLVPFSLIGCLLLHFGFTVIRPPPNLPDLYPLLFSIFSCGHFVLFLLYFMYSQWTADTLETKELFFVKAKEKKIF